MGDMFFLFIQVKFLSAPVHVVYVNRNQHHIPYLQEIATLTGGR